ncbi:hypothetical protein ACVIHH_008020 [Bradyrhizobium sp. USDA 4518]
MPALEKNMKKFLDFGVSPAPSETLLYNHFGGAAGAAEVHTDAAVRPALVADCFREPCFGLKDTFEDHFIVK